MNQNARALALLLLLPLAILLLGFTSPVPDTIGVSIKTNGVLTADGTNFFHANRTA